MCTVSCDNSDLVMEWIAIGVVKLANPNRAKKDQRAYERSMRKNGKKKKSKQTKTGQSQCLKHREARGNCLSEKPI